MENEVARTSFWDWQARLGLGARAGRSLVPLSLTVVMLALAVLLHYGDKIPLLSTAAADSPVGLSTRQSMERILILLPVTYATLAYGARGGILTMSIGFAFLLPRAVIASGQHSDHALPEMAGVLVVGLLLILVITQQRKDVEIQRATRESLRYFVRQVIRSQEDERRRIAMELHDETAQALLLTCQRLDRLVSGQGGRLPDDVASELIDLRSASVETLTDLRRLTQHLRPRVFDDHGLVAALEWLSDSLLEDYGIVARVDVAGSLPEQTPEAQLLLFRIAQEALRNAGRHSGATHVAVSLRGRRGRTTMSVTDSGRGFSLTRPISALAKDGKLGLLGMDERARLLGGSLEIRSLPGRGTTITVELPNDGPRLSLRNQDSWAAKADRDAVIFRALDPDTGVGG